MSKTYKMVTLDKKYSNLFISLGLASWILMIFILVGWGSDIGRYIYSQRNSENLGTTDLSNIMVWLGRFDANLEIKQTATLDSSKTHLLKTKKYLFLALI